MSTMESGITWKHAGSSENSLSHWTMVKYKYVHARHQLYPYSHIDNTDHRTNGFEDGISKSLRLTKGLDDYLRI